MASAEARYYDELYADFRQYYGLAYSDIGKAFSFEDAAILASQLPQDSRLMRAIDPDAVYTEQLMILRYIELWSRVAVWQNTKDGQQNINQPELLPMPSERKEKTYDEVMEGKAYVDAILGM